MESTHRDLGTNERIIAISVQYAQSSGKPESEDNDLVGSGRDVSEVSVETE